MAKGCAQQVFGAMQGAHNVGILAMAPNRHCANRLDLSIAEPLAKDW
jgi:hypothetical protein